MIKLKASHFKSSILVISDAWIGSTHWMIRRADVEGGAQSVEVHAAVLRPSHDDTRLLSDADVLACFPADQSVTYKRTQVMLDLDYVGIARLFVSDDGQIAPVDEKFVQLLSLYELRSVAASASNGGGRDAEVVMCRSALVDVSGAGDNEEVRAIVMPIAVTGTCVRMLALCASRQIERVEVQQ